MKSKKSFVAVLITAIMVCTFFSGSMLSASAYESENGKADLGSSLAVVKQNNLEDSKKAVDDIIVTPNWFVLPPNIFQASEEYGAWSSAPLYRFYQNGTGVAGAEINIEQYTFKCKLISTSEEWTLVPYYIFKQSPKYDENHPQQDVPGNMRLSWQRTFTWGGDLSFNNDSRKLKDTALPGTFVNPNTTVGTGKILVRTAPFNTLDFGKWSNYDFSEDTSYIGSLSFSIGIIVNVIILYEVKEAGQGLFKPAKYHHVVGEYRFQVGG